ncbi:MAG: AsmA family protein [Candidatus Omnitrophica bacterium]|nr:AsmA family protein [Candidatus Omnitrophota bacterium]
MKILRVIFFVVLGLVILISLAAFIFIKTFDVNKYLPQVAQQVGKAINRQVNIGHANLELALFKGISLELRNITIKDDQEFSRNNFLTLDTAYVGLDVGALIQKRQISVTDIILTTLQISIVRLPNGAINAQTMAPAPSRAGEASTASPAVLPASNSASNQTMMLPVLSVRSISIKHAQLSFEDQNKQMPLHVLIKDVDIQINNFSLNDPFDFTVSANVLAQEGQKNILVAGHCFLDLTKTAVRISNLQVKSDLSQWDWALVRNITPMLQALPVWPQTIKGNILIGIPSASASQKGLEGLSLQIGLTDGYVKIKELLNPIEQISLQAESDLNSVSLKRLEAHIGSGQINAQADLKDLLNVPGYTFEFQSKSVKVEDLLDQSNAPYVLKGEVVGQFSGSGKSFEPQSMLNNIKGEGDIALNNAKVEKLNILKVILDKLNFIPGNIIQSALEGALPSNIKTQLDTDTTILDKLQSKIKVENKVISLSDAQVNSKLFSMAAEGTIDFDLNTNITVNVSLSSDISASLAKSASPLKGLFNDQNCIYIPGKVSGKAPSVSYLPQIDYITKKVAVSEGTQQITQQLQKVFDKNPGVKNLLNSILPGNSENTNSDNGTAQSDQSTNNQNQEDPSKKLINGFLGKILH